LLLHTRHLLTCRAATCTTTLCGQSLEANAVMG